MERANSWATDGHKGPNQTEVTVAGSHFIQEDSGEEIGQAIRAWLEKLPQVAAHLPS
jgi:hypothetical protein